jgi:hypothetical protein
MKRVPTFGFRGPRSANFRSLAATVALVFPALLGLNGVGRSSCVGQEAAGKSPSAAASPAAPANASASSADATVARPRFEFTKMVAHWDAYHDPGYLPFIEAAQPDVAQLGFYGAHFWSLSHTAAYGGYPAHFPVRGLAECGQWFADRNAELRKRGVKVVGHFNVEFLVGDIDGPNGPTGFFKFYKDLWDERELGPKPVADPRELLERGPDGAPIGQKGYGIGGMHEYWACLRNPHWQAVLRAWIKRGIERGVDGYMINYFYRHNCLCEHCQTAFRGYLKERHTGPELRERFGIDNLDKHRFVELVSWHDPRESTPLRREMLRFSQVSNKRVFDELFVKHGRSLKADLIVGQWNHLGNFSQISGDERCLLPAELWGRDEDYLWYSTGDSAHFTDLPQRFLGDATLQARFIRGAFDDKPFTLGKYEGTRIRAAIAELAANGGAPMGFYTRFTDPVARDVIVQYYQFLRRHDALYRGNRPIADFALLFPRQAVHAGRLAALERFRELGREMLERHLLFDVVPDDQATPDRIGRYRAVFNPDGSPASSSKPELDAVSQLPAVSRFTAPFTVRVAASEPAAGGELDLHFVNYNREEPPQQNGQPSSGGGIKDEKPLAVAGVAADLALPAGRRVAAVRFATPEKAVESELAWRVEGDRIRFTLPEFLVYGVVRVLWERN